MIVRNSKGEVEQFDPSKVSDKVKGLARFYPTIDPDVVIKDTIASMVDNMTTSQIDALSASVAESYGRYHPHYLMLAGNILATRLQQDNPSFEGSTDDLYDSGLISKAYYEKVIKYGYQLRSRLKDLDDIVRDEAIQDVLLVSNDMNYDYLAMNTLTGNKEGSMRLFKVSGKTVETPQYGLMRVAIDNSDTLDEALELYRELSEGNISLASPIWFNSGTVKGGKISCNLLTMLTDDPDSIDGILTTVNACSHLSAAAAGIGADITPVRSATTKIGTTGGYAAGIRPLLKMKESHALFFNQMDRRSGSWAMYLEPWHKDIFAFLKAGRPHTTETLRAQDLFYALWMNDLFMEKVASGDDDWYLFCPHQLKQIGIDLHSLYGEGFKEAYNKAILSGLGEKVSLSILRSEIATSVIESGKYYMLFKDEVNRKSMHSHIGPIYSSNLCAEIVQATTIDTIANCVLASYVVKNFISEDGSIDLPKLRVTSKVCVKLLNHIIDNNTYATPESKKGAITQRAMGIGIAGLADCYTMLGYNFDSDEARKLNVELFKAMYLTALEASNSMAKELGMPEGMEWEGSKYQQGILHCDQYPGLDNSMFDEVRESIKLYGLYNTMFLACMPTASSANVANVTESFEPIKSLLYTKEIDGAKYTMVNKDFVADCEKYGIWSKELSDKLMQNKGILDFDLLSFIRWANPTDTDLQHGYIDHVLKAKYRTAYEKGMNKAIQVQAAERQPYVDQTQSMNLFTSVATESSYWAAMVAGWKMKLKTGCYYLRTRSVGETDKGLVMQEGAVCGIGGCEV
jgi:ribonucleoside-diphosphate reductase alpha chain